ncbi:MAG: D-hexose-6-phosphate mutarotase [Alteromonadaceae bacterium]|nr:MAG: D-hexose-6-phosphate mutarotase [Alteromonadaceae bacterium]
MTTPIIQTRQNDNGLSFIDISNEWAKASICLQGAHICSFTPKGQNDLLWVSSEEGYVPGKAIRGGVPVCWPWFGAHPSDSNKGAHGLARTATWHFRHGETIQNATELTFELNPDDIDRSQFPHDFLLELRIGIGKTLTMTLTTHNQGGEDFVISEALHTYFPVTHINDVRIVGTKGYRYYDNVKDAHFEQDVFALNFTEETDRVYLDCRPQVRLHDALKELSITREGSRSLVIWNPWVEKSKALSNFKFDDYEHMVCIESANARENQITVAAGALHSQTTQIELIQGNEKSEMD